MLIINKVNTAEKENIEKVRSNLTHINPNALIIDGISEVVVEKPDDVKGKNVLIIEDGPTVTHGGMAYGAGWIAAQKYAASAVVDPRPAAVGSIKATFDKFPHLEKILP